jgi:hypothetical protein
MNPPKFKELDYIDFLVGAQVLYTCKEAALVQPEEKGSIAHDAINRMLYRLEADPNKLWEEAKVHVSLRKGILVIDDTLLLKLYAKKIELAHPQWSGRDHRVENGIGLISLVWTDGDAVIPIDYRIYDIDKDGLTKNNHCQNMLRSAFNRGFHPDYVSFDSWYSGLENLKIVESFGWRWLTRLKCNRLVSPDRAIGNVPVESLEISGEGLIVHLKGYGMIKIFKTVVRNDDVAYWGTNKLEMNELERLKVAEWAWMIEVYHHALKQCCGTEKCQARLSIAQRNHIGLSIRAFLRLECRRIYRGVCWLSSKLAIIRDAVKQYLRNPIYNEFISTA